MHNLSVCPARKTSAIMQREGRVPQVMSPVDAVEIFIQDAGRVLVWDWADAVSVRRRCQGCIGYVPDGATDHDEAGAFKTDRDPSS